MSDEQSTDLLRGALEKAVRDPIFSALVVKHYETHIKEALGGEKHYIHKPSKEDRNNNIRIDARLGNMSLAELCEKYSLSNTQIYEILGKKK